MSEETREDRERVLDTLSMCCKSTKRMASAMFPERFFLKFSPIHEELFAWLDGPEQLKAAAAPRGFGKTSIMSAFIARHSLFRISRFITMISATETQAVMQSENLKREILSSKVIRKYFGPKKTENFSKEQWVLNYGHSEDIMEGTMIFPRGAGQQIRGISYGIHRPSLHVIDDLEDAQKVLNANIREQQMQWLEADVMNSVNRALPYQVVMVGTILHEDSVLENLISDTKRGFKTLRLSICDDNYKTNWPDMISQEYLDREVQRHRESHTLDIFAREMMNQPISKELAPFKQDYFKYYSEVAENLDGDPNVETIIICDPAKTTDPEADEYAILGIGVNLKTGHIYVRDCEAGHFSPEENMNRLFDMAARLNARVIAVEETGINEHVMWPIANERIRRKFYCEVVALKARGKKQDRIINLSYLYKRGQIFHSDVVTASGPLEMQLMSFPRSRKWDVMDAFAHIITVLEEQEKYFWFHKQEDGEDQDSIATIVKTQRAEMPSIRFNRF